MVECPHLVESFSLEHLFSQIAEIRRLLGEGHQVVRYDMRGTGLSQRAVDDVSHGALVLDLDAVVKATGLTGFALTGTAFSGARAIDYAVQHPEQVSRLVLWGAYARFADSFPEDQVRAFADLARANWNVAAQTFADYELRQRQALPDSDLLGFGQLLHRIRDRRNGCEDPPRTVQLIRRAKLAPKRFSANACHRPPGQSQARTGTRREHPGRTVPRPRRRFIICPRQRTAGYRRHPRLPR